MKEKRFGSPFAGFGLALLAVLAAGAILWIWHRPVPPPPGPTPQGASPLSFLRGELAALAAAKDPAARIVALASFRQAMAARPAAEAARAIREFLASGEDAPTGLGFKLNKDGSLREAPTWRTLLLDLLAQIDPPQAAATAKEILQHKTSPDEWSVCLALCARADSTDDGKIYLRQKAEEMALEPSWQQKPSVGFLEAFDVFVYVRDAGFIPQLSAFARSQENPALAHAAFLSLDRMVENDPTATLKALADDASLLHGRESMEAGCFARADVRDPAQKTLLAAYLLAPGRPLLELDAFAGSFPNENFMVSDNLLTPCALLSSADLLSRYAAARQTVAEWLDDSRFQGLRPQLRKIQDRLERIMSGVPPAGQTSVQ